MTTPKLSFSVAEASAATGLSRSMLYREMNAGRLSYVKIGDRRLITAEQLRSWFDASAQQIEVAR